MKLTRRSVLGGMAALGLPGTASAFGDTTMVDVAELQLGSTLSRPDAWKRLMYEVIQTTSVEAVARAVQVTPEDAALFEHPFTMCMGGEPFDMPSPEGIEQLSRYLSYGGFLVFDDVTGTENSGFDASVRQLARMLFPTRPLSPLPTDHSLYRAFFLIHKPVARVDRFAFLEGITVGNLCPLVYCRNDLSGALDRGADGRNRHPCVPGGERQRREAIKLGINLVMYALTANYKKDQAHVRQLMKEGRLE